MATVTTRAALSRASTNHGAAIAGHLRAAVALHHSGDRRHVILVYDPRGKLVCWCGPYNAEQQLIQATTWANAGWRLSASRPGEAAAKLQLGDIMVRVD